MYGDTEAIRGWARRVEAQGEELRGLTDELLRTAGSVLWDGRAAVAMRERMGTRGQRLRDCADRHDDAARALRQHADRVDEVKETIARIAARMTAMVAEARDRLAALAELALDLGRDLLPDPRDEALQRFVPPPPGHVSWLEVGERFPGALR